MAVSMIYKVKCHLHKIQGTEVKLHVTPHHWQNPGNELNNVGKLDTQQFYQRLLQ